MSHSNKTARPTAKQSALHQTAAGTLSGANGAVNISVTVSPADLGELLRLLRQIDERLDGITPRLDAFDAQLDSIVGPTGSVHWCLAAWRARLETRRDLARANRRGWA